MDKEQLAVFVGIHEIKGGDLSCLVRSPWRRCHLSPIFATTPQALKSGCRAQVRAATLHTTRRFQWLRHDMRILYVDTCTSSNAKSRMFHVMSLLAIRATNKKGVGHITSWRKPYINLAHELHPHMSRHNL